MNVVDKKNKAVGVVFLSTTFVMFILVISGVVIQISEKYYESLKSAWNAEEFYPFAVKQIQRTAEDMPFGGQFSEMIVSLEGLIERETTSGFYFRMPFVLAKKVSDKVVGLDMTMSQTGGKLDFNDAVVTWEGEFLGYVVRDFDVSAQTDSLVAFGKKMESEGRNFLVFFVSEKSAGNEAYQNYSVEKEQEIIAALTEADLDFVYMQEEIQKQGIDMTSLFFKTDHHWLPSTGIWADGLLCNILNEKYGYELDSSIFDMGNYATMLLPNDSLGSLGKKVTEVYTDREDFPVIVPKYDTNLEVFNSKTSETDYGSIEEILFDYSVFGESDVYKRSDYWFYGWGDQALFQIHNNDRNDGNHILLIKASMADVMYPYLAAALEDLDVLDPRYFDGSIEAYINDREPDTVIMVYGIRAFVEDGAENPLFDFR